jgi:hypothetical protein
MLLSSNDENSCVVKGSIAPRQHRQVPPVAALVAALASTIAIINQAFDQPVTTALRVRLAGLDLNYLEFRSND